MHILVIQREGLGNAILSTPLVKALLVAGHRVTVSCNPNRGSIIAFSNWPGVNVVDQIMPAGIQLILWCHPRWQHKIPNFSSIPTRYIAVANGTLPYYERFEKHEVEYLMDMAYECGYTGAIPDLRIDCSAVLGDPHRVAIGIGYLKTNPAMVRKHWGDDNYQALCNQFVSEGYTPVLVGSTADFEKSRFVATPGIQTTEGQSLYQVAATVASCGSYVGNDTGLAHVAAALRKPCVLYVNKTSLVKNHPWGVPWSACMGTQVSVLDMMNAFRVLR